MRTETLAIVFTDIKGYTATTSSQSHEENARLLRRVDRLVSPVIKTFNGRVVKSIGDAYMIVFRSPTEAVQCATAVQDRLHQYNVDRPTEKAIHIRVAMNLGEVRVHRGDVFGEPVNIAARLEGITPAGEVYFSEAIYLTMNRSEVPCERVGEYELKGIPEPVSVYRVLPAGEQTESSAEAAPSAGLRYGGKALDYWKRNRWLRRAYLLMWILAIGGLAAAAYLRYRPTEDFMGVVTQVKEAVETNRAMDALAKAGEIPATATQERAMVRPYRRQAVRALIAENNIEAAQAEVEALLKENDRDAEALLLQAIVLDKQDKKKDAIEAVESALKASESLASRKELVDLVVSAYLNPPTRLKADTLVATYVKQDAIEPMSRALTEYDGDRVSRNYLAARLEKLGAADEVDWVRLAIDDLKSTSCKVRKAAVEKLLAARDERGVGPLLKLADLKTCGSSDAKDAANRILAK